MIKTVFLNKDENCLELIDQTLLPLKEVIIKCHTEQDVAKSIIGMQVRGAPAIGVTAAYGVYLGLVNPKNLEKNIHLEELLEHICDLLTGTRPTAVNLFYAVNRVRNAVLNLHTGDLDKAAQKALEEANAIYEEDLAMCRAIGKYGQELIGDSETWLTHCNAGALATAGYGTALGVFRAAKEAGKNVKIVADETRPLLQGSRLTAWELMKDGFDVTVIADNMAGGLIRNDLVQGVVVGADRITSKGFVANKIGTYSLAVLCKYNGVPFYVAAPTSTFDMSIKYDDEIVIEQRNPDEITKFAGVQVAPNGVKVYNPAFDVTPPELITGIITDKGIIEPIYAETIPQVLGIK